uniref:40S ribosomal protein S8 n=1 Tax=Nannospalax galili TaxID=1026970 RepID=A0A8C6QY98_NANGA
MGISRDNWQKRCKTVCKRKPYKKKYELGHLAAKTKIGPRIHRVPGGIKRYQALRLHVGNFSWGSECCTRKTRFINVVYNASNNELVRTKTPVKTCTVLIDSTPYKSHYALSLGRKKGKYDERKKNAQISSLLEEQFHQGKLLACTASRPGQRSREDGYVLEDKELEFYLRKSRAGKGK